MVRYRLKETGSPRRAQESRAFVIGAASMADCVQVDLLLGGHDQKITLLFEKSEDFLLRHFWEKLGELCGWTRHE